MIWDRILEVLKYSEDEPLIFTAPNFWVFFFIVMVVFSIIHKQRAARNAFLFFASLFFYYKTGGMFFTILLFSTLIDFLIGKWIYATDSQLKKKLLLALSVTVNLLVLGFFKYAYFIAQFLNDMFGLEWVPINYFALWTNDIAGTDFVFDRIILPVGISFFTFQTISYSVDIYRGLIKPVRNLLDFGFYVSFFPQLVAGPIVRAADFIPQLYKPYFLDKKTFGIALFWIINGLLKKMFLADYIAVNFVDRVFANPTMFSGVENTFALIGYSMQVYADFSGYTDIAIGTALLMGFELPKNFNSPYKASSVAEFWKRWHMSLSSWLQDYLYIPIGGNREGSIFSYSSMFIILFFVSIAANTWIIPAICALIVVLVYLLNRYSASFKRWIDNNINLMLTMLLGGLWHGSSWNFVIWGGLNGLGLVTYKQWKKISPWKDKQKWFNRALGVLLTFTFITFTRTWFRNETFDKATTMLSQIGGSFDVALIPEVVAGFWKPLGVLALGFLIHGIPSKYKDWYRNTFANAHWSIQILSAVLSILFIYQVLSSDLQPFIYFAF